VEVYGTLQLGGPGGLNSPSFYNSILNANSNLIQLRPGGTLTITDQLGSVADGQGRWADATGQDINGGTFRYVGASNAQSFEVVGTLIANKGSAIQINRPAGAGSVTLSAGGLTRGTNGTLLINDASLALVGTVNTTTQSSAMGLINSTSPTPVTSFARLVVSGGVAVAGTTLQGANLTGGGGIVAPWVIDSQNNTFVSYNQANNLTGLDTGFQSLLSNQAASTNGAALAPGSGQIGYSHVYNVAAGTISVDPGAGSVIDIAAAETLGTNINTYAARISGNLTPTATFNTITFAGGNAAFGGLLFTGTPTISTVNAATATTRAETLAMTLAFGAREAMIYTGGNTIINAQITGSGGLTKFGASQLLISSSNSGLTGNITINQGNLLLQNPVSNSGVAIASTSNSQNIIINAGSLIIDSLLSNNARRDSNLPSGVRLTGNLGSNVFVNGDASITSNNQGFMQRINNLTIADLGANSPIYLNFVQNGITVTGTTTLGANSNFIGSSFGAANQSILEGLVVGGANGKLVKYGNGGLFLANGVNTFGTDGQIGLEIWPSTQNTATSIVGSISLTAGTATTGVFGVGDINILAGGQLRLADIGNIAFQKVTAVSDDWAFGGIAFGNNNNGTPLTQANILSVLTTGPAADGKVQFSTIGSSLGVISLDNGVQYGALDIGAMETALNQSGAVEHLWLGTSTSGAINQYYFAPTLGASTDGVYRFGGGGNQGTMQIGVNAFENVLTGSNSVQIGAMVAGNAYNNQPVINGNTNITLNTRNNYTGDTWANRSSTLNIGNNFALGSGKLVINHTTDGGFNLGQGQQGAVSAGGISLLNNVDLVADFRSAGTNFVLRGNVNLTPAGVGGTRTIDATAELSILGVISGVNGNLIKSGASNLVLNGLNTYTGTTTLTGLNNVNVGSNPAQAGILYVGTDVLPNTPGALGNSDSPLLITNVAFVQSVATNTSPSLGLSGQITFGRDIIVNNPNATGATQLTSNISIFSNSLYGSKITGGISIVSGSADRTLNFFSITSGRLELLGPISSNGNLHSILIGSTAATNSGVVFLGADPNGFSQNTYTGNTTLNNARVVVGANSYYTGAPNALTIISGPFGTGTLTFGSGNSNAGTFIGSDGANRIIANTLGALATAAALPITFEGRGNLTFINTAAAWNLNSAATTLQNRQFVVNTTQGVIQFDTNLTAGATEGANVLKQGGGILIYTGTNQALNKLTTNVNYGTSWFIDAGQLRVTNDNNLGDTSVLLAVGTPSHLVAGLPSDVQLRGGTLSIGGSFTSAHQFLLNNAASTIEVSGSNTFGIVLPVAVISGGSAQALTKVGTGTLVLNTTLNAATSLTIGGVPGGGGTVMTQTTSGTPFGAGAITLSDGTLALQGTSGTAPVGVTVGSTQTAVGYVVTVSNAAGILPGMVIANSTVPGSITAGTQVTAVNGNTITLSAPTASVLTSTNALTFTVQNQALTASSLTYNAARIQLTKGTAASSMLTLSGTLTRGTNGMATIISSNLSSDLGSTEKFIVTTSAPTNTASGAGFILATPSIVGRSSTGADTNSLNFLRYDATNGFLLHNATTVGVLNASAATSLADIISAQVVANGTIDVLDLRTNSNITAAGGSSLLRIAGGGLIMNGDAVTSAGQTISSNLRFGTGATAQEALVFVSGGQTGNSTISGNFEAFDFTKAGAGTLLLSGTANVMAPFTTGLRNLTIQEGTVRFAGQSSVASGGLINLVVNSSANGFDLNGQAITVGGLSGYGRVMNSGALNTLTVNTGIGQSTTYTGTIDGAVAITKTGNGTLTLNLPRNADGASLANTYTGGTIINAGRVTSANVVAPVSTGTLAVRNTLALGTGPITLKGGILDLSGTAASGYALGEVIDNIAVIQFGSGSGYNLTIDAFNGFGNGSTYANTTSALTAGGTPLGWSLINNVTLNASALTWVGATTGVMINGTLAVNAAGETTLNTAANGVISGKIDAAGKTLVKIGGQTLFLTNGDTGAGANAVGAWKLMAGTTEVRLSNGASNPLGAGATITLNGATLVISHEGDNTANMQVLTTFANNNLTIGSTATLGGGSYIGSGGAALNLTRASSASNKTVQFGTLAFGAPLGSALLTLNNVADNQQLSASFTGLSFIKDAEITNNSRGGGNGNVTINGPISGNGTIFKSGGGSLYINSDNSATFKGGYVSNGGVTLFGTFEGNVTTLSDTPGIAGLVATSNLGTGNTLIQPGTAIQYNSTSNIAVGAGSIDLRSNAMANYGILRMAANAPLSDFKLLIGNLGGPQDTSY
ncbi:autotransporter-associated beta strand repeat-containing protein, partial [Prosthecobacter sp.]|uniref:autotransporter-associated beta strand repeat-containing protein n=1 Tax=Prosthecobacter sp. TaxID=1965333 RepID=UPI0037C55C7C